MSKVKNGLWDYTTETMKFNSEVERKAGQARRYTFFLRRLSKKMKIYIYEPLIKTIIVFS